MATRRLAPTPEMSGVGPSTLPIPPLITSNSGDTVVPGCETGGAEVMVPALAAMHATELRHTEADRSAK